MKSIFMIRFGARGRSQVSEADEEFQSPESAPPRERPPLPSQNPEQIFTAIGKQLRDRRELLSLTLEEVERHTHIRSLYLKALENGSLDLLPSPVQTRGLLSGYATFLDLDTDRLMLQFADVIQARHRQKYPGTLRARGTLQASSGVPPLRAFIASDVLFGLGTLIAVAGLAIWGISRLLNPPQIEQTIQSTAPSISEVLAGTAVASFPQEVTLIPAADTPVPEIEATAAGELAEAGAAELINVQVNIVAVARTFMRVNVDGEEQFNGQVLPGTIYPFEAGNQIEVLTGNGAALRITFNGRELGLMGSLGEVVSRIYTSEGIATATATLPPTATATSPVTATPTFTVTSTPTRAP